MAGGITPSGGASGSGGSYRTPTSLSEINVTPLVDVMLVLLIVFMITAPLMQHGVQVDLPKASSSSLDEQREPVVLIIRKEKKINIGSAEIPYNDLRKKLNAIYQTKNSKEILVQADQNVPYGFVAQVMSEIKKAGITKVGLVTDPSEEKN
jgi:biopolymer transport protein TolR